MRESVEQRRAIAARTKPASRTTVEGGSIAGFLLNGFSSARLG
jgi:hypothetical protein